MRYILDQAEIPTVQERGLGRAEVLRRKLDEVRRGLVLTVERPPNRRCAKRPHRSSRFPTGAGGLTTTRLELTLNAAVRNARRVELEDNTFSGRVGWKAIVSAPGSGTAVRTATPSGDPTDGLRRYPRDLLASPADRRSASFSVRPGDGLTDRARRHPRRERREPRGRRLRRSVRGRRVRTGRAARPARGGVRLGSAARPLARPRQGDGGRVPDRHPRNPARRRPARRDRHGHAHDRRVRARLRDARPVAVRAARGPLPVADARLRADGGGDRCRRVAEPAAPDAPALAYTRPFARPRPPTRTTTATRTAAFSPWAPPPD